MAWTRRDFVKQTAVAGVLAQFGQIATAQPSQPAVNESKPATTARPTDGSVPLHWLDGAAPTFLAGATWGVPWPKGTVPGDAQFALAAADGSPVATQTWPLSKWADGSLKWSAHAIAGGAAIPASLTLRQSATPPILVGSDRASKRADGSGSAGVGVTETDEAVTVSTGAITATIAKRGNAFLKSLKHGDREVAVDGLLVAIRQDGPSGGDVVKRESFASRIDKVTVEQGGPVRAVVKVEGKHVGVEGAGDRAWLPFTLRLYFYAGSDAVRLMHTFIFDGDENKDFLAGLGVRFGVPMKDQLHDRHVRFVGTDGGLWGEAIRGITGLRRDPGEAVRKAQVAGTATPPLSDWAPAVRDRINLIPAWGDVTLAQLSSDGFEIKKRTKAEHAWIKSDAGTRAAGVGYVGGISGGVGFGMRDFWQRYPAQLDVRSAHTDRADVTMWLYSPDAPAMDLRFYHDGMGMETHEQELEGLNITYEDYEKGFGTPFGVARTNELYLWACAATPARQALVDFAQSVVRPPVVACDANQYLGAKVFGGLYAPVDRSTPAKKRVEDELDFLIGYYEKQIEVRRWYGFWDHGDVMHTYDSDRHVWRYDVGGFAWDNSELSPDLWLWYSYLRTGRSDVFRLAEAMTRHTGEVDVYHLGKYKGLGSRHNVMHWGCSAKQLRISTAIYRRFYYFLTADERVGDLLHDLIDADQTFLALDPIRKIRKEQYEPQPHALAVGFGTDFSALAAAWLTEYERTGNAALKEKLTNSMRTIGAMPFGFFTSGALYDPATGLFSLTGDAAKNPKAGLSHLSAVFGLQEICAELIETFDVPEFEKAWLQYCTLYSAPDEVRAAALGGFRTRENSLTSAHSRLTAYAAAQAGDDALKQRAWKEFVGDDKRWAPKRYSGELVRVKSPDVLKPIDEAAWVSTNDASQWGLAAIQNLALIGDAIPSS